MAKRRTKPKEVVLVAAMLGVVLIFVGAAFEPADPTINTPAGPAVLSSCAPVRRSSESGVPSWRCAATWVFGGRRYDVRVQRQSAIRPNGQEIAVFVDPNDPDRHSFRNPAAPALSEPVADGIFFAGVGVVALAAVGGLVLWLRGRRRSSPSTEMLPFEFVVGWLRARTRSERGASLVEYALLLALVAAVCVVAITSLGRKASSSFSTLSSQIN